MAAQVAWAEIPFLHHDTPGYPPTATLPTLDTPTSDFVRAHVPPGESIVYITPTHNAGDLYYYFRLSTVLVARNRVWWACPAPVTVATDWWHDVSSGSSAVRALAARVHARYVVYAGVDLPANLPVAGVWSMSGGLSVAELAVPEGR